MPRLLSVTSEGQNANQGDTAWSPGVTEETKSGSGAFRPRARIIKTLGEELIANQFIALQELVKNAYDADARSVRIVFEEPLSLGGGAVVVEDDGTGMTLEDLTKGWMEPATLTKISKKVSEGGRRVTGEKGIGRFAAARVASTLDLSSVSWKTARRISARFDWGSFDDPTRYLDEVRCDWHDEPAPGAQQGTVLRMTGLKDDWGRGEKATFGEAFRTLRSHLSRLVSPLVKPDFTIDLDLPLRYAEFGGNISPPAILGKPHYWIVGEVDEEGLIHAVYEPFGGDAEEVGEKGTLPKVIIPGRDRPRCGAFAFDLRVWDRSSEDLEPLAQETGSTVRDIRRDLTAASGIGIYRDKFRVLQPSDTDWLGLDSRRVQNPTLRISNNQVVGVVSITRDGNPGLTDQTNRQGIVDTPEFEDFKVAIKDVLSKLEVRRDKRRRPPSAGSVRTGGVFASLDLGPLRDYARAKHADDIMLQQLVDETERSVSAGVAEAKIVIARYRRLATLGQLVDVILHDGRTPISAIANEVTLSRRDLAHVRDGAGANRVLAARIGERLDVIARQGELLSDLFRRISPFSGRRRGRPQQTTMERILVDTVKLVRERVEELGVALDLPEGDTSVTVDISDIQVLVYNLLDNALYWLERVPKEQRRILVHLHRVGKELELVVSDSGPGVDETDRPHIFDPYFSTKPEGVGLGLTIAGELALEYDGELDLLQDGPLGGATFRVILRRRIGDTT